MSNKNRKNRQNPLESMESEFADLPNQPTGAGSHNADRAASNKASWRGFLKNHFWLAALTAFLTFGTLGAALKYLDEDARRELNGRANRKENLHKEEESFLNKINPFLTVPEPPTPRLSKEYI